MQIEESLMSRSDFNDVDFSGMSEPVYTLIQRQQATLRTLKDKYNTLKLKFQSEVDMRNTCETTFAQLQMYI